MESVPKGYPVNSANTVQNDAYTLFNLRLGYDYKPWNFSAYFEARNLTDTRYAAAVTVDDANSRFFLPGDGRAFYGGGQLAMEMSRQASWIGRRACILVTRQTAALCFVRRAGQPAHRLSRSITHHEVGAAYEPTRI